MSGRRVATPEERAAAVRRVVDFGEKQRAVAAELGCHRSTVALWVHEERHRRRQQKELLEEKG